MKFKNNFILSHLIFIQLLFCLSLNATTYSVKFYPSALAVGKLQMCHDIRFGYEFKFKTHQNIELGIQASMPHLIYMPISTSLEILNFTEFEQLPYSGGGGFISYKYQFQNYRFYLGASLFSAYYQSWFKQYYKNGFTGTNGYDGPEEYYTKIYMNEINTKLGWIIESKNDLDIAFEIGYRYNKGYLVFNDRIVEMPSSLKQGNITYYSFLHFPLKIGIDLSINLSSIRRSKK